jgi:hypothetical protein
LGGGPPTQCPFEQVSFVVHAFPSLHAFVLLVCTHNPPEQVSVVHEFPSSHCDTVVHSVHPPIGVPTHDPPAQ